MLIYTIDVEHIMTDGKSYYDGLIQQGYPADQALTYTQQYYPGFTPAVAPTIPAPALQPVAQPMVQPMVQQPVQQMTQPGFNPAMMAAPNNMAPMGVAPMTVGESKPIMTWAAVGCIVVALLLTIMGQFGNSWQTPDEDGEVETNLGLRNMVVDCTDSSADDKDMCINLAYVLLSKDMEKAANETAPSDPVLKGDIEDYCENTYSMMLSLATQLNNDSIRTEAGEDREACLKNDTAGGISGMILWIGIIGSLAATVMLVMSMLGQTLPGGVENYGKISSWVSGGLILFAAILWMVMKDNIDDNLSNGSSFYLTFFAGLLAVGAGVLDMLDKREK